MYSIRLGMLLILILLFCTSAYPMQLQYPIQDHKTAVTPITAKVRSKSVYELRSKYSVSDWQTLIDDAWGEGLPTDEKLAIFDRMWNEVDARYAAFQNLDIDWDALHAQYRPEIEAGVSRGRFSGIMNHLGLALQSAHTTILDVGVSWGTLMRPGVPLFMISSFHYTTHFGANLTPLPDSSLLVYKVVQGHPLGLERGDLVLGYEGVPWKTLYKQLLEAQLPLKTYWVWGSTEEAITHQILSSAGMNWHLFDTIDIVKYSTGDTLHLSTSLLDTPGPVIRGREQLPIPGVQMPDLNADDHVSWGIVEGTQIGYIYVSSWDADPRYQLSEQFYEAIYELMFNHETTGMIIDMRLNYGGYMLEADDGYSLLFNTTFETADFDVRSDPNNHFTMTRNTIFPERWFMINGNTSSLYDKPIALLTGPGAVSNGDWESLRLQLHPMVRSFGKPSSGAFTLSDYPDLGHEDWFFYLSIGNGYLVSDPQYYLAHTNINIDESVWLTQEDVAQGNDTVVERAIEWIRNLVHAHDVSVEPSCAVPGLDDVTITAEVENPNGDSLSVMAYVENDSGVLLDSVLLSQDTVWSGIWQTPLDEMTYFVSIRTTDLDSGITRILPRATQFTTIGPIAYDSLNILLSTEDRIFFNLTLHNEGTTTAARQITASISSSDTCISEIIAGTGSYGNIAAGESVTSIGNYLIFINENCSGEVNFPFDLYISNELYNFWNDSFSMQIIVGVEDEIAGLPLEYSLSQAYPNPFNPITAINYFLPQSGDVSLIVYNLLGDEVTRLVDNEQPAGNHQVTWDASNVASGIYFYRLQSADFIQIRKMLLLK